MLGAVATTSLSSDSPLFFGARASVGLNWLMTGYLPFLIDRPRWCDILKLVEVLAGGKGVVDSVWYKDRRIPALLIPRVVVIAVTEA